MLLRILRLQGLARAEGVTDRAVAVSLGARFVDELLSGLFSVLMPTFRREFRLSITQVGLLEQVLFWVATPVEPIGDVLIDVWRRRALVAFGAVCIATSLAVMGVAAWPWLLFVGFAIYGLGSGPLCHTADVVLVESYPTASDRVFARGTLVDSLGALLPALIVAGGFALGIDWRVLVLGAAIVGFAYAAVAMMTPLPLPAGAADDEVRIVASVVENMRAVATQPIARKWLLFMFVLELLESPHALVYVWLREGTGMSQALVGVYGAVQLGVGLVSLVALDRLLFRLGWKRVALLACAALVGLYPIWVLTPGVWPKFALGVPLTFAFSMLWPIGRANSLAALPGKGGAITAVSSLFALVPTPLLFAAAADATNLASAILTLGVLASAALFAVTLTLPRPSSQHSSLSRE